MGRRVWLFVTLWTVAHQFPLSMGFFRQEYWSRLPFPSPEGLPDPGIELGSPALQADSLPSEPPGKPRYGLICAKVNLLNYLFSSLVTWGRNRNLSISVSLSAWKISSLKMTTRKHLSKGDSGSGVYHRKVRVCTFVVLPRRCSVTENISKTAPASGRHELFSDTGVAAKTKHWSSALEGQVRDCLGLW